jgi:glycosyltransferase involved in cell wall biosynthesis
MKVLLSAYACEPNKGSEPGVGWQWTLEIASLGYDVWVLTRSNNREHIEAELAKMPPITNLHFIYYDLPRWTLARWWKKGERRLHLYYFLWQWGAYLLAKRVHETEQFDQVHHVTFVSLRQPSFMGNLGIPFIFGPVSGGERAPWRLRMGFSLRNWIWDGVRDLSSLLSKVDPLMRRTFKQAERIYVTSEQSLLLVPRKYRHKASVHLAIGFNSDELPAMPKQHPLDSLNKGRCRILYIGRLVYWKGMHLGIPAFARLLKERPDARLTIVGSGPEERQWRTIADKLGVGDQIDWIHWQAREKLSELYASHDVFLFPSLHDSGGMVVLEAMAHGLPVACLNIGGPGIMVDATCGLIVETAGLNKKKVIQALADRLVQLAQDSELRKRLSEGATERVKKFRWSKVAGQLYSERNLGVQTHVGESPGRPSMKVLLSAYACEPNKGSEPGVGWQWTLEIASLGYDVWVLTRSNNREHIEAELAKMPPITNLHFIYYDLPRWTLARWWKKGERRLHLYYFLWQWGAYLLAKRVHETEQFDQVHHVTFVSLRQPSFMGNLGIPFIFGPVSGGERAPWRLRMGFSLRNWIWDGVRDLSSLLSKVDPLMRRTFKQAERIYVTSEQSLLLVPRKYRHKASVHLAIGFNSDELPAMPKQHPLDSLNKGRCRILYIGRLVYWKGMHLGIPAFARLLKERPDARLTIVGSGPEERQWRTIADKLGVGDQIDWIHWQAREKLSELYASHDVFIYPTLQDPGGMVMLEAMAHGLPVVCLDHQGTGVMVDATCGLIVETAGLNKKKVIQALADRLVQLAQDPKLLHRLSEGAVLQAGKFSWSAPVGQLYSDKNLGVKIENEPEKRFLF